MAKNDWIVAGINNPDFTSYDFSTIADMNLNNTQMLSKEEYLKSDFIKNNDLFKDESGNFSNKKFDDFYRSRLQAFKEFQEQEFPKGPELDMFDTDRTKDSRIKDIRFDLGRHVNPDRQAVGIEGVRVWSDPTQTKSEIAQSQKIWDTANNEYKDYSSNDKALSNGLFDWLDQVFSDPLVLAQYEEDGTHVDPITGLTKKHSKGDYKLNDKGTYYYETLDGRSPIGKEVLSVFDTLSVDGEGINKYDFFDSDDIEKSISGVIAKNVATLLPLFTPIGTAYSAALVAKEFSKAIPMLYGVATMLFDQQEQPTWVNNVAAWGSKLSGGTSQYAKENTFSFENFGNLIADVALQWGQQKAVAQAINSLRGSNTYIDDAIKNAENLYKVKSKELGESAELWKVCQDKFIPEATKLATQASQLGRDASLAYMAIVSNSDLYTEMRNQGLTNREAAAVSLGSTLGMFGLNKYTGLGEIFFDDATDDAVKLARKAVKAEMKDAMQMFKSIKQSNLPEPNKYLSFIKTAADKAQKVFSNFQEDLKYHTLNLAGKAAGEGLEEVSEELISDVAKEVYQLAGYFGVDTTLKDIGAWDNALERYSMSFIGGALGGGIFYGKEALMDGKTYKRDKKNWEIATLIRNGHGNELRAEIEKFKNEGKLASTKLSASKFGENDKGERVWLTTENKKESQNDAVANAMLEKVNALEAVINNNRIGLSDEQLFENMVLTEKRFKRYEKVAPLTNYYQDFSKIVDDLIAAELDYKKASNTIEGTVNGNPINDTKLTPEQEAARQLELQNLQVRIDEARKKKDEFLAGDTSLEYTRKLNFIMDPTLHSQFLSIDRDQYLKEQYGDRRYEELSPEERIKFELDWSKKVETTLKDEVNQSWDSYKKIENLIIPELEQLALNTPEYKKFSKETENLFNGVLNIDELVKQYVNWDTKLDLETPEEFASRNSKLVIDDLEESDDAFLLRKFKRAKLIEQHNDLKNKEWVDKVNEHLAKVGYNVDPFTYRILANTFIDSNQRKKDIVNRKLQLSLINPNLRQVFSKLNKDLSNIDEIKQMIKDSETKRVENVIKQQHQQRYKELVNQLRSLKFKNTLYTEGNTAGELPEISFDESPDSNFTPLMEQEQVTISDMLTYLEDGTLEFLTNEDGSYAESDKVDNLIDILTELQNLTSDYTEINNLLHDTDDMFWVVYNSENKQRVKNAINIAENELNTIVYDIKNDTIYKFIESLKTTVKNPIGELIKSLASKTGDEIPNIDELLSIVQSDLENIEDANQLILDDVQMSNLKKVKDYMKLINGFMYAASSNPDKNNPQGHNQVINAFAQTHQDKLLKEWKPLPEIDSDYFTLYDQSVAKYNSEIKYWIDLSNRNSVNKIRKFVATDRAFNVALFNAIKSRDLKFKLDEEEFDLLEGLVEGEFEPEVKLFNTEQLLYKNFQKALKKSGLSVSEFFKKSGLLEKLVPSISNISKQQVASLTDTLKKENLTDFDLLQYFAQIFTLNPSKFYSELKSRVKNNEKVAPITAQEYSTKLAQAITSSQYRDIMKYAYEKSESGLPYLSNTLIIPGVAGAGKTSVVLSSVNNADEEIIVAGPTKTQATKLQQQLNKSKSYTFNELLETILGTDQLNKIRAEFDKVKMSKKSKEPYDCEYFSVKPFKGEIVISLKKNALKFNTLPKIPKKLFLDEATHLSSLEAQILDAYAESVGAVNYLAGDPNQRGFFDVKSGIGNLQEGFLFSSRAPKLSISLRDNNLQKYINQENVRALLDDVNSSILNKSSSELEQYWTRALNTLSKFNFKVYNHDVLNGDLITKDLNQDLINKLKTGSSIGFIGDKSSPYLQTLRNAGIEPTVLSMKEMQGEEFDFVVIDQEWKPLNADYNIEPFLTSLYTTMTRARTAAVFIDNGLSNIIGKNVQSDNKSQAPSILAGVQELREKKLNILDQFKLDLEEEVVEGEKKPVKNPDEDFIDPDKKNADPKVTEVVKKIGEQDKEESKESLDSDFSADGEHLVETFTDTTIIGAEVLENQTRIVKHNGKDVELKDIPVWVVKHPAEGPLRNLQALFEDNQEIIKYSDKKAAQQQLFDIKSSIIYEHGFDDLPVIIRNKFNKRSWEEGTLEIEIREPSSSDVTHLNAKYDEPGFEYKGKRYIANVVFKVKNRHGKEVIFDISGLPEINRYRENLKTIKAKLEKRIVTATGDEKVKLEEKLKNTNVTFANYEKLLDSWIQQYESGTFVPIKLDQTTLNFNKTTWFQDLKESGIPSSIQLGGKLDPVTGKRSKDNLMLRHQEMVFSPIYTYASHKNAFEEIDPSLKGKAIVLVSSDTLLKPDQLMQEYINQKYNPTTNTARVRMLVLDNYGMNFSQFIDKDFIKSFQHGDEERKPVRQNYTGIRMFTSLWNWRAGLIKFNEELAKWQKAHSYSDEQIEALTEIAQIYYDKEHIKDPKELEKLKDPEVIFKNNKLTKNDLDNLNKFNQQNCENIPIFRLGFSKNGNGFYVKEEEIKSGILYDKPKVNLLAISKSKAEQFQILIDRLLSAIEYSEKFGDETLGLRLLKEDQTPWKPTELIDLKNANHRRTLSGLLSDENGKLLLQSDGKNIAYADGSQWSIIPALISNITRTITYFQKNPDEMHFGDQQYAKTTLFNGETRVFLKNQIGDLFSSNVIQTGNDSSLFDLLNLVFHGTSDDIHKELKPGDYLMQLEDAYFKQGFFINPDISRTSARNGDPDILKFDDENGEVLFYYIETSPELFTVDTNIRTSGLGLRVNELYNKTKAEEKKKEEEKIETPEKKFRRECPELTKIIEMSVAQGLDYTFDMDSAEEAITWYNKTLKEGIKNKIKQQDKSVLDLAYNKEIVGNNVKTTTLREYLSSQIGSDSMTIKFNKDLIIESNGKEFIMNSNFEVKSLGAAIVEPGPKEEGGSENSNSKYQEKLSDGTKFSDALLKLLDTENRQAIKEMFEDVSDVDLDQLLVYLTQIFNSNKSDEEIQKSLEDLSNNNETYSGALDPYIQIMAANEDKHFQEIYKILREC